MSWPIPDYPEQVLLDMARFLASGYSADYFKLDDGGWLKRTHTHNLILVEEWWVCTFCHAAEQYCECDGLLDELTRPEEDDADGIEFGGADPLFEDWDWGL